MKERCPKCNGYIFHEIVKEGGAIIAYWKCINCGIRIYKKTPFTEPEFGSNKVRCKLCGRVIFVKSRKRKYCHDCRLFLHKKRNAQKRSLKCATCGREFRATNYRAKYCPDCRRQIYSNARKKYMEAIKMRNTEKIKPKEAKHALSVS